MIQKVNPICESIRNNVAPIFRNNLFSSLVIVSGPVMDASSGIELSCAERRARVVMLQSLGWTGGMCLVPLVAWLTGDWVSFVLLPLFPAVAIFICAHRYNWLQYHLHAPPLWEDSS
jgi:hypothetical protein